MKTRDEIMSVAKTMDRTDRILAKIDANLRRMGCIDDDRDFLEYDLSHAVEKTMQIGHLRLDKLRLRCKMLHEYDFVGIGADTVAVVGEVKLNLLCKHVRDFAERLPHFSAEFPLLANGGKIFGMVAGETITPAAKKEAKKRGFFILRLKNKELQVNNADGARPIN